MTRRGFAALLACCAGPLALGCNDGDPGDSRPDFASPTTDVGAALYLFALRNTTAAPAYFLPRMTLARGGESVGMLEAGCNCRCDSCDSCTVSCSVERAKIVELGAGAEHYFRWDGVVHEPVDGCGCEDESTCGGTCYATSSLDTGPTTFELAVSREQPSDEFALEPTDVVVQEFDHPLSDDLVIELEER